MMEKIKNVGGIFKKWLDEINKACERFEKGDLRKSDLRRLMFLIAALTAAILLISTANVWMPYVFMLVVGIMLLKPEKPVLPPMPLWYQIVTYAIATVNNDNYKRLGTRTVDAQHFGEILNTWHVTPEGVSVKDLPIATTKTARKEDPKKRTKKLELRYRDSSRVDKPL